MRGGSALEAARCLSEEDHGQEQSGYRGRHAENEQRFVLQPAHKAHFGTLPGISTDQAATMLNVGGAWRLRLALLA